MGKPAVPQIECVHVEYSYPKDMSALYRATSTCGKTAELIISPTTATSVIPLVLSRIVDTNGKTEFDFLLDKMNIRPENILRFLVSNCQELVDSLQDGVFLEQANIEFIEDNLKFKWLIANVQTGTKGEIQYEKNSGQEIDHSHFYESNEEVLSQTLNLSKRDVRKIFVITKKIIKLFPRVSTKNTPIRGLYNGI